MMTYRWLTAAEAEAAFPNCLSTQELVQNQSVHGVVEWSPDAWAGRLLELAESRLCRKATARRYRAAAQAMQRE